MDEAFIIGAYRHPWRDFERVAAGPHAGDLAVELGAGFFSDMLAAGFRRQGGWMRHSPLTPHTPSWVRTARLSRQPSPTPLIAGRSEATPVGNRGGSQCSSRWSPDQ